MKNISPEDKEFLDVFFSDELSENMLKRLDEKLKNHDFKAYYEQRLNQKFDKPASKIIIDYLPMLFMIALVIFGVILALKQT